MSGGADWSPDEIETLIAMKSIGMTNAAIAASLPGRTVSAVATKSCQMGLSAPRKHARPLDPIARQRTGLRMGSLRDELSPALQERVAAVASKHNLTVAGAVAKMLERVE